MRRAMLVVAVFAIVAVGVLWHRHREAAARERSYVAKIESIVEQRATQAKAEMELGEPVARQAGAKCAEEWIYEIASDRRAVLCFDEGRRATTLTLVRSFDRRDF